MSTPHAGVQRDSPETPLVEPAGWPVAAGAATEAITPRPAESPSLSENMLAAVACAIVGASVNTIYAVSVAMGPAGLPSRRPHRGHESQAPKHGSCRRARLPEPR